MSIFCSRKYLKYESLPQRNGGNTTKSSESLKVDWNTLYISTDDSLKKTFFFSFGQKMASVELL